MSKPNLSAGLRVAALLALPALLLAAALARVEPARAQSGRRAPKTSATPEPTPDPAQQGESESESRPRQGEKKSDVLVSFVLMLDDTYNAYTIDPWARGGVAESFARRLGQSTAVSVSNAGKGRRQEARERAKAESTAYVVLLELEDEEAARGRAGVGRADPRALVLKTYVYTPKTADLKFVDTTYQRPYRPTARIGGVNVPVPGRTPRVERYPSQYELEQAARDAADRLLSRFNILAPPDN